MSARLLLGRRVNAAGEQAGHVTGVLLDGAGGVPIGLEVSAGGSAPKFLPWVAATVCDGSIELPSALLLVDSCDAYLARGAVVCRDPEAAALVSARRLAGTGIL